MRQNEKINEVYRQRAEQVRSSSELIYDKTKDWQMIKKFMSRHNEEFELTAQQQRKFDRYNYIYSQLVSAKYSEVELRNQVMNMFKVSMVQAYEDMGCTKELFATVLNINKRFELNNELQIAKDCRRKCIEIQDFKNAALFTKLIKDLLTLVNDEDLSPGEDFEGHEIEAVFDPQLLGAPAIDMMEVLTVLNAKRKVPIKIDMFEHIKFEEEKK